MHASHERAKQLVIAVETHGEDDPPGQKDSTSTGSMAKSTATTEVTISPVGSYACTVQRQKQGR